MINNMPLLGWKINLFKTLHYLRSIQPQIVLLFNSLQEVPEERLDLNQDFTGPQLIELAIESDILTEVVNSLPFSFIAKYDMFSGETFCYFGIEIKELGPLDTRNILTLIYSPDFYKLTTKAQLLGAITNDMEFIEM